VGAPSDCDLATDEGRRLAPPRGQSEGIQTPRGKLVELLTATIATATAAGDLHAARVAHEALGRLLMEAEPGAPTVADFASERAKRGSKP
jgi:hypothetical protein